MHNRAYSTGRRSLIRQAYEMTRHTASHSMVTWLSSPEQKPHMRVTVVTRHRNSPFSCRYFVTNCRKNCGADVKSGALPRLPATTSKNAASDVRESRPVQMWLEVKDKLQHRLMCRHALGGAHIIFASWTSHLAQDAKQVCEADGQCPLRHLIYLQGARRWCRPCRWLCQQRRWSSSRWAPQGPAGPQPSRPATG